jgi:hypothetical protein
MSSMSIFNFRVFIYDLLDAPFFYLALPEPIEDLIPYLGERVLTEVVNVILPLHQVPLSALQSLAVPVYPVHLDQHIVLR